MVPDDPLQPCLALVPGHGAQVIEPLISLRMGRRLRRGHHGDELRRHQAGVPHLVFSLPRVDVHPVEENRPSGGYHFHGVYEYIPVESLEKMTEMLVYLLTGIDGTKKNGKI